MTETLKEEVREEEKTSSFWNLNGPMGLLLMVGVLGCLMFGGTALALNIKGNLAGEYKVLSMEAKGRGGCLIEVEERSGDTYTITADARDCINLDIGDVVVLKEAGLTYTDNGDPVKIENSDYFK